VKSKIERREGAMRMAYDFTTSQTGEGIKENEGYENFAAKVTMKLCYMVFVSPARSHTFLQLFCRLRRFVHFITHSKRNLCQVQELKLKQQVTDFSKKQDHHHHQVIVKVVGVR
jgi:hypothetical protein